MEYGEGLGQEECLKGECMASQSGSSQLPAGQSQEPERYVPATPLCYI